MNFSVFRKFCLSLLVSASIPVLGTPPLGIYELNGVEADLPTDDLAPFGRMIKGATVVGLGESVHTSRGYYQAKLRLIKYLVEKEGFRFVSMETPWLGALPATEYVEKCSGTSLAATQSVFGVFQDIATQQMFEFLCDWNRRNPADKVVFYGYDIQEVAQYPIVLNALKSFGMDQDGKLADGVRKCIGAKYPGVQELMASSEYNSIASGQPIPADEHAACMKALEAIHFDDAPAGTSSWTRASAKAALLSAKAWQKMLEGQGRQEPRIHDARDEGMARVAHELHRYVGMNKKVVNWAHNGHLQTTNLKYELPGNTFSSKMMGVWLKEFYGETYRPFAISGYQVQINWPWANIEYPELPMFSESIESDLHKRGYDYALVDFREGTYIQPGVSYVTRDGYLFIPRDDFRGMIFLNFSPGNIYAQ